MSTQKKNAISTTNAPAAIGPYSQAVRVGDMLFASGQVGLDPATGQVVAGGIVEQTRRAFENIKAVLAAAGSDLSQVVKTTVFLKNMGDFRSEERRVGKECRCRLGADRQKKTDVVQR